MALKSGTRLGNFEVVSALGEGGMGAVYRARDSKLGRDVAIKVLLPSVVESAERLARFEREAKTLAALNHSRIAQIYGLEDGHGTTTGPFLVMELVEGPTLADRLAAGPLRIPEAMAIATQIAEALQAAHDAGIVHRDLKPANIKLKPDSSVKVLDFGLAKALESPADAGPGVPAVSQSPTITTPARTQAGLILGTAAYMSPEQARGRTIDRRTDIWAFGCVLYEMLTGQRTFGEDDVTGTLAAVVLKEPDWTRLPVNTPAALKRILHWCLQKDPAQRARDIADVRFELERALDSDAPAGAVAPAASRGHRRLLAAAMLLIVALGGLAAYQTVRLGRTATAAPPQPIHFSISAPPGYGLPETYGNADPDSAVSPDGTRLVLRFIRGSTPQLFIRDVNQDEARPIPGTEGANTPFFSPDGKWIAFTSDNTLKKVASAGGPVSAIGQDTFGPGSWGPDDTIVYTPDYASGLWQISSSGGTPKELTKPNPAEGELGHWSPQVLPDGKSVLFTNYRSPADTSRVEIYSLTTGTRKVVVDGGFFGRYLSTGHLLFTRGGAVSAVSFDLNKQEAIGQPTPVLSDVAIDASSGLAHFSVSNTGTLSYFQQSVMSPPNRLAWLDRSGRDTPIPTERRRFEFLRLSPDGKRLALSSYNQQDDDVWVYDLALGRFSRITSSPTSQNRPVWSRDGKRLYFLFEEPVFHIYTRPVDTTAEAERILGGPIDLLPLATDKRFLVYQRNDPKTRRGLWLLPLDPPGEPRAYVDTPAKEIDGDISPDGKWFAYTSDESGHDEVYINSFPVTGVHMPVSSNGGREPLWARDGKELYFLEGDKLVAAPVRDGRAGHPEVLFERRMIGYDVAPNGRFIAVLPDDSTPAPRVAIVLNWFEELKKLVPPAR